jgi:hypothetical protein
MPTRFQIHQWDGRSEIKRDSLEAVLGCWTTELRSVICRISDTWRNSLVLKPSSTRIRTGDLLDKVANKWLTTLVTGLARMTVATGDQRLPARQSPRSGDGSLYSRCDSRGSHGGSGIKDRGFRGVRNPRNLARLAKDLLLTGRGYYSARDQ